MFLTFCLLVLLWASAPGCLTGKLGQSEMSGQGEVAGPWLMDEWETESFRATLVPSLSVQRRRSWD